MAKEKEVEVKEEKKKKTTKPLTPEQKAKREKSRKKREAKSFIEEQYEIMKVMAQFPKYRYDEEMESAIKEIDKKYGKLLYEMYLDAIRENMKYIYKNKLKAENEEIEKLKREIKELKQQLN